MNYIQKIFSKLIQDKTEELAEIKDIERLQKVSDSITSITEKMTDEIATLIHASLKRNNIEMYDNVCLSEETSIALINSSWREAFIILQSIIKISEEVSVDLIDEINSSKTDKDRELFYKVLFKMHSRSVVISKEILLLLKSGYSDGALARWRSLHENVIVFYLLTINTEDKILTDKLITRYLDYMYIDDIKEIKSYQYSGNFNIDEAYEKEIQTKRDEIIKKYGKRFLKPNMWAEPLFDSKVERIQFHDLEKKAELNKLNQYYMKANTHIHTSAKGMYESLSLFTDIDQSKFFLFGGSSYGQSIPLQLTAISLMQITSKFLLVNVNMDSVVINNILLKFVDECCEVSDKIRARIENNGLSTTM